MSTSLWKTGGRMKLIDLERNARLYTNVCSASLLEHFGVLSYETGALAKCIVHERWNEDISI